MRNLFERIMMRRLGLRYDEIGRHELYDINSGEKVGGVVRIINVPALIEDDLTNINLIMTLYTRPARTDNNFEAEEAFDEWIKNYDNMVESNGKIIFAEGYKAGKAAK